MGNYYLKAEGAPGLNRPSLLPQHGVFSRNLPEFPDLGHNKAMEPLFHFAFALLNAGAPWLAAVIVVAIAVDRVGPIRLNLSIGDRSSQIDQPESPSRTGALASAGRMRLENQGNKYVKKKTSKG